MPTDIQALGIGRHFLSCLDSNLMYPRFLASCLVILMGAIVLTLITSRFFALVA